MHNTIYISIHYTTNTTTYNIATYMYSTNITTITTTNQINQIKMVYLNTQLYSNRFALLCCVNTKKDKLNNIN